MRRMQRKISFYDITGTTIRHPLRLDPMQVMQVWGRRGGMDPVLPRGYRPVPPRTDVLCARLPPCWSGQALGHRTWHNGGGGKGLVSRTLRHAHLEVLPRHHLGERGGQGGARGAVGRGRTFEDDGTIRSCGGKEGGK